MSTIINNLPAIIYLVIGIQIFVNIFIVIWNFTFDKELSAVKFMLRSVIPFYGVVELIINKIKKKIWNFYQTQI